jgi:hypothetical protein
MKRGQARAYQGEEDPAQIVPIQQSPPADLDFTSACAKVRIPYFP